MTSISHALIGASIAAKIGNPYLAGSIALISHFACDAVPHWDLGTNWRNRRRLVTGILAITETLLAITGTFLLFRNLVNPTLLLLCIFFSLVPDWLEVPYYLLLPDPPKIFQQIYLIQSKMHNKLKFPDGLFTQILVVAAFLFVGFIL